MGCNCKGNGSAARRRPFVVPTTTGSSQADTTSPGTAQPPQTHALDMPNGDRTTYASELEAQAAKVRAGYVGTVTRI